MRNAIRAAWGLAALEWLSATSGCGESEPPAFTYYDQRVAPVLEVGCAQQTTGCHVATSQGTASGNLDLTSYEGLLQREDVLPAAGPYAVGQLLLKGGDPLQVPVQTFDPPDPSAPDRRFAVVTTDVRHAGGRTLREGSEGYARLKSWIAQGYTRDGAPTEPLSVSEGACRPVPGVHRGFDPAAVPADAESYQSFVRDVQPVLVERCAGSTCHGNPIADLYISCGTSEAQARWNYFASVAHADVTPALSELLRRPLAKQRGGTFHEGGTVFATTEDPGYVRLRAWIEALTTRAPEVVRYRPEDEGERFFGNYVQPMLVKKGCMFGNCHSPAMFHELRLRTGSQGVFSRIAFDRNYDMAKLLLSVESADPNDSRIISKNLSPPERGGRGLAHRGGALLEDFGAPARKEDCAAVDVTKEPIDGVAAYCVLVAWHALERRLATERGQIDSGNEHALLYVSRPLGVGDPRDFDSYRPNADLLRAPLTLGADGRPSLGVGTSLLAGCGLSVASADIRGVAVSWDAKRIAFGARTAADRPLRLYEADADGGNCAPLSDVSLPELQKSGILLHDFDPAYAPDGRLVFASTRGNLTSGQSPTRTPSQLAPNANLYVHDPGMRSLRQLTFLSNQELQPSFMADGRMISTTEKRAADFLQLAGRRQNIDGGDYHPLFGQRASVGFELATEIVELADRNLALVAAPHGAADGAGTIAIINRSIGPDQDDRDPTDRLYLHSLRIPAPGAFDGQSGAFRSPAALPSRWLVCSCDPAARDLRAGGFDFDLCALDPVSGEVVRLGGVAGRAEVEAVAVYPRQNYGMFDSRPDEVNGHTRIEPGADDAIVHMLDFPLLSTLLFSNTRTSRPIDPRIVAFEVFSPIPPPVEARSFDALPAERVVTDAFGRVYVHNESLGRVPLEQDGSARVRLPGGRPLVLGLLGAGGSRLSFEEGAPFRGEMLQREEIAYFPGERANQGFKRSLFDGMCGGCHGPVSGRELDVAVDIDVLTSASKTLALQRGHHDLVGR
jgi:hypothetical protein